MLHPHKSWNDTSILNPQFETGESAIGTARADIAGGGGRLMVWGLGVYWPGRMYQYVRWDGRSTIQKASQSSLIMRLLIRRESL